MSQIYSPDTTSRKVTPEQITMIGQRIAILMGVIALVVFIYNWLPGLRPFIPIAVVAILLLLAIREIMCWYWKLNLLIRNQEHQMSQLQQIIVELQALRDVTTQESTDSLAQTGPAPSSD